MAHSAKAIANEFLMRARDDGRPLTTMKVIKLVYIAHGWALALLQSPLIEEDIEAWQYGPVIRDLWQEFKIYGRDNITQFADERRGYAKLFSDKDWENEACRIVTTLDDNEEKLLDAVWELYGEKSAIELSALTHQPDTPWSSVYEKNKNAAIGNKSIKKHFMGLIVEQ